MRKLKTQIVTGTSVALATAGLSCSDDNGAVDPPPPPFRCEDVDDGRTLNIRTISLVDSILTAEIEHYHFAGDADWLSVGITTLDGANLVSVVREERKKIGIVLELLDSTGSFTIEGVLESADGKTCVVSRTITFDTTGDPILSQTGERTLPLDTLHGASIEVCAMTGSEVELRAQSDREGSTSIRWSVSEGETTSPTPERLIWTLPAVPGLYQARLQVEFGKSGLALDSVVFEVG